jgi:crotonobetainyl-CoA:carnitine CoA-transferase CaiB-like acyl-CoA transferase
VLSIRNDVEWQKLCALIDAGDLASLTADRRHVQHQQIDNRIAAWTQTRSANAAFVDLQNLGIAAGPVRTTTTLLDDANLVARGFWQELPHPKMHAYRQAAPLWRLSNDPDRSPRRHSPLFGEHNDEILRGELGLDDGALANLARRNITATAPINPGVG